MNPIDYWYQRTLRLVAVLREIRDSAEDEYRENAFQDGIEAMKRIAETALKREGITL